MRVNFDGIGQEVVTFLSDNATAGKMVAMSANHTVKNAGDGTVPVGVALHVRQDYVAVQVAGYVRCPYSGSVTLGWNNLACTGSGVLRPAGSGEKGRTCLVTDLDSQNKTMGLFL